MVNAGVVVELATVVVKNGATVAVAEKEVTVPDPAGVKHPVALPFGSTPLAAAPLLHRVGVAASAVAVAELPVVL
jgi:hypothetical protein